MREGVVRSVKDFGAFVDLGGVDGLLHVSEMSWVRVADATKVVQPSNPRWNIERPGTSGTEMI